MSDQPCPRCADMQRAVTQTARENRSLEKRIVALQAELMELRTAAMRGKEE